MGEDQQIFAINKIKERYNIKKETINLLWERMDDKEQDILILLDFISKLETCRDHWKTSYTDMKKKSWFKYEIVKEVLSFYARWKGISQEWNSTMRTKRDREAWKLIKEIVIKINRNNGEKQ